MKSHEKAPAEGSTHPRNKYQGRYELSELKVLHPELNQWIIQHEKAGETLQFSEPGAVTALNKALMKSYYGVENWNFAPGYLCPPVPGRADYIHHLADLLAEGGVAPTGTQIKCLDVGVGASCIYPIIGHKEYQWSWVGSDIDQKALNSTSDILDANGMSEHVRLRLQDRKDLIFYGIIRKNDLFDAIVCNPPFHATLKEALAATKRKVDNLGQGADFKHNFEGMEHELVTPGGEKQFIHRYIQESRRYFRQVMWFTVLVSKEDHLKYLTAKLKSLNPADYRVIDMYQGNKRSRMLAWTYQNIHERSEWQWKKQMMGGEE
jgi:23S rRNA (adenine1618-N6)-methyltransferase